MKLIDNYHLLTANQTQLLHQNVGKPFSFGEFKSLDDILTQLDVDVIIEKGEFYHSVPESLKDAEAFWKGLAARGGETRKLAENTYEEICKEKDELSHTLILGLYDSANIGLYDSANNCIILYPEAMMLVYGGMRMDELLVSTLAHETMHAYFNRPGHDKYPYIYFVEEPLAEFGMLVYLHQTGSSYYNWARQYVLGKSTCYRYGAQINLSNSSNILFLTNYKIKLPTHSMLLSLNGTILLKTATGFGTIPVTSPMPTPTSATGITPVQKKMKPISKRAIVKTAFDNLYADLGYDLTDYLRTNLANGTMTRTPATIQLTNGSFINVGKWAPTGSSRAIILEVNKADYPLMDTAAKYKDRDRFFPDIYEANQLYPDSVFLLSNQWGAGSNSFNHIIDDFCKSVNIMTAKTGRRSPYFSPADITYLKTLVKGITPPTKSASTPTASPTSPTTGATPEEP